LSLSLTFSIYNKQQIELGVVLTLLSTTITPLTLLVRLGGYIANLSDFYSYSLIGKLTAFLYLQEFCQHNQIVDSSTDQLKSKVGLVLVKETDLRITLHLDEAPIISKSHTHPSHSQTSRLLTSSLSLGIPVPQATQCSVSET
jgi:hypothetical protein